MTATAAHEPVARRQSFRVRPAYLVLLIFLGLFSYKFIQKTQEVRRLAAQAAALQSQNDRTAEENQRIQQEIKYYHTANYVEGQARALLGYIKPGDVAVQVQPHYRQVVVRATAPRPQQIPPPVWRQWWRAFFD